MSDLSPITEALVAMDEKSLTELVQNALDQGVPAKEILNNGLITGMDIVGEKMESGDMFIPEVLKCAKIMSRILETLKPLLADEDVSASGKLVIGTVKGDLHDIGKNLVIMMFESAGFEVHDLGIDVSPERFVEAINEKEPDLVGLSALLTTTMPMIKQTIDALTENGVRNRVKVIVGGAPVTQSFAVQAGADGYAPDAGSATKLGKNVLQ